MTDLWVNPARVEGEQAAKVVVRKLGHEPLFIARCDHTIAFQQGERVQHVRTGPSRGFLPVRNDQVFDNIQAIVPIVQAWTGSGMFAQSLTALEHLGEEGRLDVRVGHLHCGDKREEVRNEFEHLFVNRGCRHVADHSVLAENQRAQRAEIGIRHVYKLISVFSNVHTLHNRGYRGQPRYQEVAGFLRLRYGYMLDEILRPPTEAALAANAPFGVDLYALKDVIQCSQSNFFLWRLKDVLFECHLLLLNAGDGGFLHSSFIGQGLFFMKKRKKRMGGVCRMTLVCQIWHFSTPSVRVPWSPQNIPQRVP